VDYGNIADFYDISVKATAFPADEKMQAKSITALRNHLQSGQCADRKMPLLSGVAWMQS
jgi:hypothetical protein